VGDGETGAPASVESTLKYHPNRVLTLTPDRETGRGTVSGGQFDWGGRLLKSNGGAQRFPQAEWKPAEECKGRRELDCETHKSNRDESRA
jgi:hypothetical protein